MSSNIKYILGIVLSMSCLLFGADLLRNALGAQQNIVDNQQNIIEQRAIKKTIDISENQNNSSATEQYKNNIELNKINIPEIILENEYVKVFIKNDKLKKVVLKKYSNEQGESLNIVKDFNISLFNNYNNISIVEQGKDYVVLEFLDGLSNLKRVKYSIKNKYILSVNGEGLNIIMRLNNEESDISGVYNNVFYNKNDLKSSNSFSWIGGYSKYWITAFYNLNNDLKVNVIDSNKQGFQISHANNIEILLAPKSLDVFDDLNLLMIDNTIEFGWLYFIVKPMLYILKYIYKYCLDYGLAIILLTLLVKLVFVYFNYKAFYAMRKMKKIQPEIEKINAKYNNDSLTKSNKIFALYSKEGISMFAQILPMVLQIPIFYSIFKLVSISVEFKNATSLGFITDLSALDSTNILFFLPIVSIGILPVLTGFSFWVQNLTNVQSSQQGAEFMRYIPIVMIFVSSGTFSNGLMLYLITNNVFTALQQYIMSTAIDNKIFGDI